MKQIGYVEPSLVLTDDGSSTLDDPEYAGGSIMLLTRREVMTLVMLQDACSGSVFRWPPSESEKPNSQEMSSIFCAILSFVEAKFAINEFKAAINKLDSLLMENEAENV